MKKNYFSVIKMTVIVVVALIFLGLFGAEVRAEVVWSENFDGQADWQLVQPQDPALSLSAWSGESTIPPNFDNYYISAYQIDVNQHNSIIIGPANARGGVGKAITFWNESCSESSSWQSDNQIGANFGGAYGYPEIWVQMWIKFDPTWQFSTTESSQEKMSRVAHYWGSGSPFVYFESGNVRPIALWGLSKWGDGTYDDSAYHSWRYEHTYYPGEATPVHSDNTSANFGVNNPYDNQWHKIIYHAKLNTAVGVPDGEYSYSIDDVLMVSITDLAYGDDNAQISPRLGWNEVGFGGNSDNPYASCHDNAEQWYALDDLCVATSEDDLDDCFSNTSIWADVDDSGAINSTDAMLTLRNSLSLDMSSTNWQVSATTGDANCDSSSNSTDAMLILRQSLGLDMTGTGWCVS